MFKIVKENSNWITSSLFLLRFRWLLIFIPISVQFFFLIQFLSLITQITIAPKAEILKMFQKISGQLFKESVFYNYFYEKWNTTPTHSEFLNDVWKCFITLLFHVFYPFLFYIYIYFIFIRTILQELGKLRTSYCIHFFQKIQKRFLDLQKKKNT